MELFFLFLLLAIMAVALGSGYPVAFALPGAAIITIMLAAGTGYLLAGNTDAYFHTGGPSQWLTAGVTNLRGIYLEVERDTLIAIPLFIFMGIMLQRSKIAEDLLVAMAQLFGSVPGGLGISVVFVGALLAATTGIVGATVVAMGLISLPAMLRNNYSQSLATGTIAASGTLGQIIPPSIVLIILADQLASATDQASTLRKSLYTEATGELSMPTTFDVSSTSAGEMFLGALVPGLVLVGLYMLFILIFALLRPKLAPAVPYEGTRDRAFWGRILMTLIPPLALIFLVLGSIIGGIATVNQAGAIGAAGALIMAGYRLPKEGSSGIYLPAITALFGLGLIVFALANYEMNIKQLLSTNGDMTGIGIGGAGVFLIVVALIWSGIRVLRIENTMQGVMLETAKTTSLVFIILLGAAMLTAAFRAFGGEDLVKDFLNSLPGGFWTQFIIVMVVIFVLGFFLDFIEIAVVVVPIVAPILLAAPDANISAVWLGVMIGLNIQTSFLTPPFGFALFYLRGVAPAIVKTLQIYKGVIAFICLQLVALAIVGYYPQLVNYLPNRVSLLSESSPPPRNPSLQYCLEEYVHDRLENEGDSVRGAIANARGLDISMLPDRLQSELTGAFDNADAALEAIDQVWVAHAAVEEATPGYLPQLREVRDIERMVRSLQREADEIQDNIRFLDATTSADTIAEGQAQIAELESEMDALRAEIPEVWEANYDEFSALVNEEERQRNTYRRSADNAVQPVSELLAVLDANAAFAGLEDQLRSLGDTLSTADQDTAEEAIKSLSSAFGSVAGANDVNSSLSRARRHVRRSNTEEALEEWQNAVATFEEQLVWREAAQNDLRPGLETYLAGTADTIGARQQDRLTRSQAVFIAGCSAGHRDLSLYF